MSSPGRILYIDDNKDSRELVRMLFDYSDLNYEITSVESAENAISLMESQVFDLYIIDYALPVMSGTELCRYIRGNDSKTPILFFSAMARPADCAEGIAAGANEYLVKPNDLDRLTKTVEGFLGDSSLVSEASPQIEFRRSPG